MSYLCLVVLSAEVLQETGYFCKSSLTETWRSHGEDVDVCDKTTIDNEGDVDGVRLRLWTAATNGPIVHPQGDIIKYMSMESNGGIILTGENRTNRKRTCRS
jgi:hypothetical protein